MAEPKQSKKLEAVKGGLNFLQRLTRDADESVEKAARRAELMSNSGDNALPLVLPRARMSSDFIDQQADRVARQMLGEHVTSGKPKDTTNLAGRSMKESQRVKGLNYKLRQTGNVAQETPYTPRKGDVKVAFPGDQTVSDSVLESVNDFPIDSVQQGGARYGLGQRHLDDPEFWKSTEGPAKSVQGKVDRVSELYEPERVIGSHLAMGPTSNNFAMHFADANLRAIDWSKANPKKINVFDNIIAGGYKDPKTGEMVRFPNWPGMADREAALAAMKEDSNLRKWFNNRMKTPSLTEPLGLPNGLDIQYAITEPRIRDMEINMTGLMTGELKPGALVEAAGNPHNTYSHRILGEAGGPQEVLTPFVIDFPDAAQHIASTKRPSDFTGTIQKVFPHQLVDDQYIDEYNQYRERIKKLTGQKKGGAVDIKDADTKLAAAIQRRMSAGGLSGGGMAKGGKVDIKATDALLSQAIARRMAGGGGAFKKIEFMDKGGKVGKVANIAKSVSQFGKNLLADRNVLPAVERDANLAKMLEGSATKERLYHATGDDFKSFSPEKTSPESKFGSGIYMTPNTKNANFFANIRSRQGKNAQVMPVYSSIKNPYEIQGVQNIPMNGVDTKKLKDLGYDGVFYRNDAGELQEVVAFEPTQVKSAIGNRGTYDLGDSDITKAEGGPAFKTLQFKAEGGGAFKTLQFKEPQHFDGGGIASPEEVNPFEGASRDPILSRKEWENIKRNAPKDIANAAQKAKQHLKDEASQLGTLGGVKDLALRTGASYLGGIPDLVNLGLSGIDAVADTNLASDKPYFGSQQYLDLMDKAGILGENEFPVAEFAASFLSPASLIKKGKRAYDKFSTPTPKTPDAKPLASPPPSVKLQVPPEAKTASTGKPQGATYATKQDGPFYRVSPTALDVSGAKSRGLREADELQGQATLGGGAGQTGSQVPSRISDEEVARLIADPVSNQPLQIAQRFTKETQGTDFALPVIPESSLAKQSAIGRAHQLAVEGSPEYKSSVFDAYAKQMPDLLEQAGAKDYDDLMEKAYRQLAKETDDQFKRLPYNFSYHRAGEGDYKGSKEMMADVHGNKHLYVFQGGDPHDFLNRLDQASGLNENEKFRAVHDLLGHAVYGNQFGPKGEELAYAVHQQMYSPLARLAMASETRGQNSLVNYSPLNARLKASISKMEDMEVEARRRGDNDLVRELQAAKRQEYAKDFQFAPQKAVLLPPEFIDPKFTGGLPDYLSAANRPAKGTESQSVLTHFSNSPDLQMLDPKRYGTGIKGAEAERLREYAGGVKDRSYVYLGEPGTIAPEPGLGVNRYRGESQNLYDITKDPLNFRTLARESNRTPFTAKYNAGVTHPLQDSNDFERLVKEYGYEGMINPNASKPMGIMFQPTPVQPRARGGLTQLKAR